MKKLFVKYREIISYLFFGVLTTAVGMGSYFLILTAAERCGVGEAAPLYNGVRVAAQIIQWVLAVLFAYYTNKNFVFRMGSRQDSAETEAIRVTGFFASRLFSLLCDSIVTFGTIFLLGVGGYEARQLSLPLNISVTVSKDLIGKLAAAVVVIIVNYVLSKFIVFRNKGE